MLANCGGLVAELRRSRSTVGRAGASSSCCRAKGIADLAVLARVRNDAAASRSCPPASRHRAYEDSALPIGSGQTISQPSVHARYLQSLALTGHERVLEIGTGSGYQTVLLSILRHRSSRSSGCRSCLSARGQRFVRAPCQTCHSFVGDGTLGWREFAPYDAILVSAAAPDVPRPLAEQLSEGGRMVLPLGDRERQMLVMVTRHGDTFERRDIAPVRFVPLVGAHGWGE